MSRPTRSAGFFISRKLRKFDDNQTERKGENEVKTRAFNRHGAVSSWFGIVAIAAAMSLLPLGSAMADEMQDLKTQMKQLREMMQQVQEKMEKLEEKETEKSEDMEEVEDRLDKVELHTATDKISLGVELRTRGESIHYDDLLVAPPQLFQGFFTPVPNGFNGATLRQIQGGMAMMGQAGMVPPPTEGDVDNDIIYTNRFRLNMSARVAENLTFGGCLAAYKVFGDSTEVKVNGGSLGDVTFDGNTSSLPHGDTIHLERVYLNYTKDFGLMPVNFSLGRRPSTDGPPLEYRNYSLEGGSPLATIINWQFDGASLNFGLEDVSGVPGLGFKICYGVGFEGDWGNSYSISTSQPDVDDVHMLGFISTFYDDDLTSVMFGTSPTDSPV